MDFAIPFRKIEGVTLDSRVGEVIDLLPGMEEVGHDKVIIYSSRLPAEFERIRFGDLFYLAKPVGALTHREYLKECDPKQTISSLYQEEARPGFCPVKPGYFVSVE